jgi:phosphoesterase RecJ-like protein
MDDGLASYLIDVDGVAFAALFREAPDGATRVSVRTVAPYDAAAVCALFGGGGHVRAAGATIDAALDDAIPPFVAALEAALDATDGV